VSLDARTLKSVFVFVALSPTVAKVRENRPKEILTF